MANKQTTKQYEACEIAKLLKEIADRLDECCEEIDGTSELYDINTDELLSILDGETLKRVLTQLLHYSPANAQELKKKFERIKKWAISLDLSTPRPSKTQTLSKSDYPSLVLANISYLTFHLPETAKELRRVAKLMEEVQKSTEPEQVKRRSIIGRIVEVIIAIALLVVCSYVFGMVTGIFIFAALLTIFHLLGWLEPIRAFIYNILWSK